MASGLYPSLGVPHPPHPPPPLNGPRPRTRQVNRLMMPGAPSINKRGGRGGGDGGEERQNDALLKGDIRRRQGGRGCEKLGADQVCPSLASG